jgi:hypothetical protein
MAERTQSYLPQGMQNSYSTEAWHSNPTGALPVQPIGNAPPPCWFGSPVRISWTNNTDLMPYPIQQMYAQGKITHFASWSSPIFDLRPMFQGYTANGLTGRNFESKRAVAIWTGGGTGMGGKLFAQVELHTQDGEFVYTENFDSVQVLTYESGHVSDVGKLGRIGTVQDSTLNFALDGNKYIILGFMPFGEGMPIRYWQQTIWFTKKLDAGIPVPFTIQGAFY